jgi:hypothetical protein
MNSAIAKMVQHNQLKKQMTDQSHDQMILDVLIRLGGKFAGRVMELRRHLPMPIREAQIKDSLKRLTVAEKIKVSGEKNAAKGNTYEVYK